MWTKTELILLRIFMFLVIAVPYLAYGGKEITANEPVITWNLYTTPIVVAVSTGIILAFINRIFKKGDKKDLTIATLLAERESLKEIHLAEKEVLKESKLQLWQQSYTNTQCGIKNALDRIEENLGKKVEKDDCIRESTNKWREINNLKREMGHEI